MPNEYPLLGQLFCCMTENVFIRSLYICVSEPVGSYITGFDIKRKCCRQFNIGYNGFKIYDNEK